MATTVKSLIDRALEIVVDETGEQWSRSLMLNALNEAQKAIILARPDAKSETIQILLARGVTKQALPNTALRLLGAVRNMGVDGATPGLPVRLADQDSMDAHLPGWHSSTPKAVIKHYVYDATVPREFYVWPRPVQQRDTYIEAKVSLMPAVIADEGAAPNLTVIELDDSYALPILQYMLFSAYSQDMENVGNAQVAQNWMGLFNQTMGIKTSVDLTTSPNRTKSSAGKP